MEIKEYNTAPANIKARLIRLNSGFRNSKEIRKISRCVYSILTQVKDGRVKTTKYDDFIYEIKPKKPNGRRVAIYFDKVGFDEFERKTEWENIQIQTAYLEFIERFKLPNILPNYLYKDGFFGSYYGAWQAVNRGTFHKRPEVRDYVLNWLKEREIEVKF